MDCKQWKDYNNGATMTEQFFSFKDEEYNLVPEEEAKFMEIVVMEDGRFVSSELIELDKK